uniref:tRNA-5-taurinomethyluridine 2-sulfurtransferase n=1 Tax=Albugo laibachii Nc14 TaxID=890382 RepID=F0WRA3_9STRA|nr:tRNAspecific 2thiouridylase mnmA putative [Albugo laibachii Nc14]CCA24050.1 tRNAspecific 2thiouridylase mnmA putative [Albugo laibachii Nc14]|eukprot:CCA24050.1 tRNAspecific 2thiouridylase mnmA putative [Albugo laibachii Nc14]
MTRNWRRATQRIFARNASGLGSTCAKNLHVVIGMSGGVDSSVAALLLKQQGHKVTGVYMKNWDSSDEVGAQCCPQDQDLKDVQSVCKQLDIPIHTTNFVSSYWNTVFAPCLEGFEAGLTPNPDILCNREIKFKEFIRFADTLHADVVATGHYALLKKAKSNGQSNEYHQLYAGLDPLKDQTYFLSQVPGSSFSKVLFPLGSYRKAEVREIAKSHHLHTALKRDSVGLCFIGKRQFGPFINQYITPKYGFYYDVDRLVRLKAHKGFASCTVGQRASLDGMDAKYFIAGKRKVDGTIFVARGTRHPALFSNYCFLSANNFNWIAGEPPLMKDNEASFSLACQYRARYRQQPGRCVVSLVSEAEAVFESSSFLEIPTGTKQSRQFLRIDLEFPQRAITPGQTLALYGDDGLCYGGGPVEIVGKTFHELGRPISPEASDWRTL